MSEKISDDHPYLEWKSIRAVLFLSYGIFEGNYMTFRKGIQSLEEMAVNNILKGEETIDLSIWGGRELSRLIHNYASAWYSLVDQTRNSYRISKKSVKPEWQEFALQYEKKLEGLIDDSFENLFIKELRNYVQHRAVVVPSLVHRMTQDTTECTFEVKTDSFVEFDWSSPVKDYLSKRSRIALQKIFETHFLQIKEFYLWIEYRQQQLAPFVPVAPVNLVEISFDAWKQQQLNQLIRS